MWLRSLRSMPRLQVRTELMLLPGVGPKVADCVALFSLDQHDAVPVDTHVRDICLRDYACAAAEDAGGSCARIAGAKSLTPAVYEAVGDLFRRKFQVRAGWWVVNYSFL